MGDFPFCSLHVVSPHPMRGQAGGGKKNKVAEAETLPRLHVFCIFLSNFTGALEGASLVVYLELPVG